MSSSEHDTPEPGSAQQQLVARLARSAASASDTQDLSLSDTVARRVIGVARRGSGEMVDESHLQSLVGDVTRQVVVSKAALVEALLSSAPEAQRNAEIHDEADPDKSVGDEEFAAARRQLAQHCDFIRSRLQPEEWYLFRRHYLEEASWDELAADIGIVDEGGVPDGRQARARLVGSMEPLSHEFTKAVASEESTRSPEDSPEFPATALSESNVERPHESMLTWGLTEPQLRLAERSLPWVRLTPVEASPPVLPLTEPLLVSATQSDSYLTWATGAEQTGTRVEPVVMLLSKDTDHLPPQLWSYSNGTVTPNDWSRAEELLNCSRLIESEAVAMSVQLDSDCHDVVTSRQRPIGEFSFDADVASEAISHVGSCATCRVAFNDMVESRLKFGPSVVPARAGAESAKAAASQSIELPQELQGSAWQNALPEAKQSVWLLLTIVAGFVGADVVREILSALEKRGETRPEVVLAVFTRLLQELRRRANRPRPPGHGLASYTAASVSDALETGESPDAGGDAPGGGMFGALVGLLLGGPFGATIGFAASVAANDQPAADWNSAANSFLAELAHGLRAQANDWTFTLQWDSENGDLQIHSVEDSAGQAVQEFAVEVTCNNETPLRITSESGRAVLPVNDLTSSLFEQHVTLKFHRP